MVFGPRHDAVTALHALLVHLPHKGGRHQPSVIVIWCPTSLRTLIMIVPQHPPPGVIPPTLLTTLITPHRQGRDPLLVSHEPPHPRPSVAIEYLDPALLPSGDHVRQFRVGPGLIHSDRADRIPVRRLRVAGGREDELHGAGDGEGRVIRAASGVSSSEALKGSVCVAIVASYSRPEPSDSMWPTAFARLRVHKHCCLGGSASPRHHDHAIITKALTSPVSASKTLSCPRALPATTR
jgi:hypothetical protein